MSRDRTGARGSTGRGSFANGMTRTGGPRRYRRGTTSQLIRKLVGREETKGKRQRGEWAVK